MQIIELDTLPEFSVPLWCILYADWLSERGVPDGGWRALGVRHKWPYRSPALADFFWLHPGSEEMFVYQANILPRAWWLRMPMEYFEFRSAALSAAAEAFLSLSPDVQDEILGVVHDRA